MENKSVTRIWDKERSATIEVAIDLMDQLSRRHRNNSSDLMGALLRFLMENPTMLLLDFVRLMNNEIPDYAETIEALNKQYGIFEI
jgi:FMN phosphatase YigB (HAD superfamily)